jgi:hypothetical protein
LLSRAVSNNYPETPRHPDEASEQIKLGTTDSGVVQTKGNINRPESYEYLPNNPMKYAVRLVASAMESIMVNPVQYRLDEKYADDQQADHTVAERNFFLEADG